MNNLEKVRDTLPAKTLDELKAMFSTLHYDPDAPSWDTELQSAEKDNYLFEALRSKPRTHARAMRRA